MTTEHGTERGTEHGMERGRRQGRERERDLDRFLTFVDAMVAIAITLLVLPLVDLVPQAESSESVGALLGDHGSEIGAFFISFWVIARLWYAQHLAVRRLIAMDARVFVALMLWVLTIVFLPFPTALVASHGSDPVVKTLYIGTFTLSMLFLAGVEAVVARDHNLVDGDGTPEPAGAVRNAVLLVLALGVSLALPVLSYWPLLLLLLDEPVARLTRLLRRHIGRPG